MTLHCAFITALSQDLNNAGETFSWLTAKKLQGEVHKDTALITYQAQAWGRMHLL
jgi:hypothetical protein